jgi:hypothetical protein
MEIRDLASIQPTEVGVRKGKRGKGEKGKDKGSGPATRRILNKNSLLFFPIFPFSLSYTPGYVNAWKLSRSIPTTRCQPSRRTNRISLNGKEIIAGGTMSMPIETVTAATTRSTIRNGK